MQVRMLCSVAALALCLSTAASSASTVKVNVGGVDWDVTTVEDSFNQIPGILRQQVWWGNPGLADSFAQTVRCLAICDNNGNNGGLVFGPLFAYGRVLSLVDAVFWFSSDGPNDVGSTFSAIREASGSNVYAIASPAAIPLPAGGLLLLTGLAAAVWVGKLRKKVSV